MNRSVRHRCLATCGRGLEELLRVELESLGVERPRRVRGGVAFTATTRQLYDANLWLRTAERISIEAAEVRVRTFARLEQVAADIDWSRWLGPDTAPDIRVSARRSRLFHTGAVAERLQRAIGARPDPQGPAQRVEVRVVDDRVTIAIDSSGEPLHKRGWRPDVGRAPLRETLAAAMLLAAGWDGTRPLVDPFCGSGTIPIEAAAIARDLAPGRGREFAFSHWPSFEPGTWASVAGAARSRARAEAEVQLVGFDRDDGAVTRAMQNADRAGVGSDVTFERRAISDATSPAGPPGWLVTNPPYGKRVGTRGDLRDLYARFGQVVATRFEGWSVGLLAADDALAAQTRLGLEARWRSSAGPIPITYLVATEAR